MKLKYYLRGLGIGIIVSTIVLTVSFCGLDTGTEQLSDEQIMARARELGMVMPEEDTDGASTGEGEDVQTSPAAEGADEQSNPTDSQVTDGADATPEPQDVGGLDADLDVTGDAGNAAPQGLYRLVIEPGDVCRVVCENLAANGVIQDSEALRSYLFEIGYASNMSIGSYDIPYGLTNEEIAAVLMEGPIEVE